MRSLFFAGTVACIVAPTFACADLLDRYRDASVAQADRMQAFMMSRVPEIEAVLPDNTWTPAMEAVATCTLEGLRAARGDAGAEAYVAALEDWSATEIQSFATMVDGMDPILGDDLALQLSRDCGGMDLAAAQVRDSGLADLMSKPEVMDRLMAE